MMPVIRRVAIALPQGEKTLACRIWGEPHAPVVLVCLHSVMRNARDFDRLARRLSEFGRVVCPDFLGHGESDYLGVTADYPVAFYVAQIRALQRVMSLRHAVWLGTSLGGYVAMNLALDGELHMRGLILNDAAPFVLPAISRAVYLMARMAPASFASFDDAIEYHRTALAGFGPLSDSEWEEFTRAGVLPSENGGFRLAYDREMFAYYASRTVGVDMWDVWQAIDCPTLLLRGESSSVVTEEVASRMARSGPRAQVVEFAGTGHAPSLLPSAQITVVREWISAQLAASSRFAK